MSVGFYERQVFSRLMDRSLGSEPQMALRRELLDGARGRVLEIGFGTGLNLSGYPPAVEGLTAVEPSEMLKGRVRERMRRAPFPVRMLRIDASGRLPVAEGAFDTAVSTWTLCTIPDAGAALRQVRRALKPSGTFLFMEHGRSESRRAARWQDRLNPVQNFVACGCNLNRRIDALVRDAGFEILRLERFLLPEVPRPLVYVLGSVYRGEASPATF